MKSSRNLGIILSYFYLILNTIISVFISAFIIKKVGKTDYGVHQSMSAFLSYLVLLEFGTGTLMKRNLSLLKRDGTDKHDVNKNISTIWTFSVFLALIISVVAFIFWLSIGNVYTNSMTIEQMCLGRRIFLFAAGNTVLSFFNTTLNGILIAFEKYLLEKVLQIIRILLRVGLLVLLLTIDANVVFVSAIDCLLSLSLFIILVIFCIAQLKVKLVFKYFDKLIFKSSFPLAAAMLLQTIVNVSNGSVDKFCISVMLTPEDVSVYSISMTIFNMFSSIATVPISMFMPTIARNMRNGLSHDTLTKTLLEPCRICVMITGFILCGFIAVGKEFVLIIYGVDFAESWIYAIIVIIPMFFNMTNGVILNVLDILNKRHVASLINLIGTLLNILLTVFGIMIFGMLAAAIATAISLLLQTVLLNIFYKKRIGINVIWLFKQSYKGVLPSYILALLISILVSYFIYSVYVQFFVGGTIFVIVSFLLLCCFGLNKPEKQLMYKSLRKLLKKKTTI